jgi:uncharacterized transporter YbjL
VEALVSRVFALGSAIASILIAAGCAGQAMAPRSWLSFDLTLVGVVLFVFLPVIGVALMSPLYFRERRHALGLAALAILIIITMGSLLAVRTKSRSHDNHTLGLLGGAAKSETLLEGGASAMSKVRPPHHTTLRR